MNNGMCLAYDRLSGGCGSSDGKRDGIESVIEYANEKQKGSYRGEFDKLDRIETFVRSDLVLPQRIKSDLLECVEELRRSYDILIASSGEYPTI